MDITGFEFTPRLTVDGIAQIVALGVGGLAMLLATLRRIDRSEQKIDSLTSIVKSHDQKLDKLIDVQVMQAHHEEQLSDQGRRISQLEGRQVATLSQLRGVPTP